eukprot:scaffold330257_cov50-Prasinocladus_malaysianus.AAC.1
MRLLRDAYASGRWSGHQDNIMLRCVSGQAIINENTTGDAAVLRNEITRLRAELAAYQSKQSQ